MEWQSFTRIFDNINGFLKEIDKSFLPVKHLRETKCNKFEVVVITASIDEYHSFSRYLEKSEIVEYDSEPSLYLRGYITNNQGREISIIMPIPGEMGIAAASINATKSIINFCPDYLFMVGICAGIRAIANIGDIVLAEKTIDYNEVVEIENKDNSVRTKFMNNVITISTNIKSKCQILIKKIVHDFDYLKNQFNAVNIPNFHFGILATGSALLRNGERVKQLIKDYHNIKGIDMETYGIYKAVSSFENRNGEIQFLSVKSVSDYADNNTPKETEKSIDRRNLALHNSSFFLHQLILSSIK